MWSCGCLEKILEFEPESPGASLIVSLSLRSSGEKGACWLAIFDRSRWLQLQPRRARSATDTVARDKDAKLVEKALVGLWHTHMAQPVAAVAVCGRSRLEQVRSAWDRPARPGFPNTPISFLDSSSMDAEETRVLCLLGTSYPKDSRCAADLALLHFFSPKKHFEVYSVLPLDEYSGYREGKFIFGDRHNQVRIPAPSPECIHVHRRPAACKAAFLDAIQRTAQDLRQIRLFIAIFTHGNPSGEIFVGNQLHLAYISPSEVAERLQPPTKQVVLWSTQFEALVLNLQAQGTGPELDHGDLLTALRLFDEYPNSPAKTSPVEQQIVSLMAQAKEIKDLRLMSAVMAHRRDCLFAVYMYSRLTLMTTTAHTFARNSLVIPEQLLASVAHASETDYELLCRTHSLVKIGDALGLTRSVGDDDIGWVRSRWLECIRWLAAVWKTAG
ncbi:hypothetical protein FB45DRAFT_10879 [Roridomyces roridus]|uniref:Uncharacterized protein n=1 Tax=Roridomyces roridus TaxID=1738132 RepID=A0AAD7CIM9_9AGAR|nr:hypothetical protein FB45DRAFT_10879 [Roridomyces roridus]